MKWETPRFEEINMSAEIGGYQSDFDGGEKDAPPSPTRARVRTSRDDAPARRR
jgi:hypothetical protein